MNRKELSLKEIIKNKFKNYSDKRLLERLNKRGLAGKNDDDELFEILERSKIKGFKLIPLWDTYKIVRDGF